MAKIWMFDLEGVLKHGVVSVDGDLVFIKSVRGNLLAMISDDVYVTPTIQLKLNAKDMEVLRKYTENL